MENDKQSEPFVLRGEQTTEIYMNDHAEIVINQPRADESMFVHLSARQARIVAKELERWAELAESHNQ